jgi:dihydrolipoamide dehydrogenase
VVYASRRPALKDLGLETVGLKDLAVDQFQATKVKGVFAIGDVSGGTMLSHLASAQGLAAAENALKGGQAAVNPRAVPRVIYTRPQVAAVGLTEAAAKEAGYDVVTGLVPLGVNAMAMIQGQAEGVIKVVGEAKYGELLGVHLIGPTATELIGLASLAIQMEATLEDLARAVLPHPTIAESLADAARAALGRAVYLPKQSGA